VRSGYSCSILLIICACSVFAASGTIRKEALEIAGAKHDYFVFAPNTAGNTPAPMIVLLHGSGRDGRSLLDPWRKLAGREGVILLAPNAINSVAWQTVLDGPGALISIVENVKKHYAVDPGRIYLFGHSGGAVFALLMLLWEPRYFAAISVHAGAFPEWSKAEAERAARGTDRKTPIQIQVGTEDPLFPLQEVRQTRDLLAAAGFTVDLREIAHHDHNYAAMSSRINEQAWNFFSSKRLLK
jgi:poly(3-hydroxybutyrate) depolymerase